LLQNLKDLEAKPKPAALSPATEQEVIRKFKALPLDRKNLFRQAIAHPCPNCEQEFEKDTEGRSTGKSHGVCKRHAVEMYADLGVELPADFQSHSVDLAQLSPEERKLLAYLNAVIRKRQTAKGVWD
jgi:hypothetical protein